MVNFNQTTIFIIKIEGETNTMCGIIGVYGSARGSSDVAKAAALGMHALQHRGQESMGIFAYDEEEDTFHFHRDFGLVGDNLGLQDSSSKIIESLSGHTAIGHTMYSTSGRKERNLQTIQPLFAKTALGGIALAHNGNLTNTEDLKRQLRSSGYEFQSSSDTEVILALIVMSKGTSFEERIRDALSKVEGAYSLVVLTREGLMGIRDPSGYRPLSIGQVDGLTILASETCAFDLLDAKHVRDIERGEIVIISKWGERSQSLATGSKPSRFCIFEPVYFARPDSILEGESVYNTRERIGAMLAAEHSVDADVVVPVPDSGVPAGSGYAEASGIPLKFGITRNHYMGRIFIEPEWEIRHLGVKLKHNANRGVLAGNRVILVDDSIVRGTTARKIVEMVRKAGAVEVHLRIAFPPVTGPCYYGIDTPVKDDLIASGMTVEKMRKWLGVDSLAFISIDGLYKAVAGHKRSAGERHFCDACVTGDYPTIVP